jgi:hypothetical protein
LTRAFAALLALGALAGCDAGSGAADAGRPESALEFPRPDRPASPSGLTAFSTEAKRDSMNEAQLVMDLAQIGVGTTVADIGAGEGYYTVRLAERVGPQGRVLAQDIDRGALERLGSGSSVSGSTMSRSSWGRPMIRACRKAVSTASSWSTCIMK